MLGLTLDEATAECEIWPDNWRSVLLFDAIATQWRIGMSPVGLDYNVLYHKLDRMNLSPAEYEEIEADIRVLEDAALATMRQNK